MVTTAMAQINYGKNLWTFPATDNTNVTEVPAEIFTDFAAQYNDTELTNEKVGVYTTPVRVNAEGDVTATFVYNGGNIRMDIAGIDLVNADGEVVYSDYHFGFAGGQLVDNVYTLTGVAVGDYTMRLFIPAQKEDITSSANDSKGTITLVGAWMYPNENVFYNIKNVRSNKYATFKGEGNRFTQENASNGAGSYWHFVEASLDDVKAKNNAWLDNDAIPAGYKAYWIYNAACELPVENVTNGYMSAVDASPWPAKIYYVGVHTKDGVTGLVIRPCNEDASSWNDDQGNGTQLGHYYSNDAGSLWSVEVANVGESDLIAIGTAAKNEALATVAAYEQAYYYNHTAAQIDAVETAINNIDCSTVAKALTSVIDGSANAVLTEFVNSSKVTPKAGDKFMIRNVGRNNGVDYLCANAEGDVKTTNGIGANDLNALDLVWTLMATENEGKFNLYNERLAVYVGALSTERNGTMGYVTDAASAGVYEVELKGVYVAFHAAGQDEYGYIHHPAWSDKRVTRWLSGELASQWQLIEAPFELTTDIESPICYAIKSGRDGNYYFTLENNKIKLVNNAAIATNNATHWFFMLDNDKNLKIYPFADKENTMGYITVADGNTKLTNDHTVEGYVGDTYTLYYNTNNAAVNNNKCFAFRPTTGDTFVSNHGGTGNYMGFYAEHNDKGTRIGFERINDVVLAQKVSKWEQYFENEGDKVCQYVIADGVKDAVNTAVVTALTKTSTDADYRTAIDALDAFEYPTINMPEKGKYYRLKGAESGYYATSNMCAHESYTSKLAMEQDGTTAVSIWYLSENNAFLSYVKGQYLGNFAKSGGTWSLENVGSTGNSVVFADGGTIGKYQIKPSSGRALYGDGIRVDAADENNNSGHYNWILEEVTELPVTISAAGYATFYAPVAVEVPAGVTAHTVTINGEWATLSEALTVVPAKTGVVLAGAEDDYDFAITTADAFEGTNALAGTVAATNVTDDAYVLSYIDTNEDGVKDEVGFYTATKNQSSNAAWKNNSHKAYLVVPGASEVASYSFRFGEGTTGVEKVEMRNEKSELYDLTGRRVENIAAPGIYIVNGKKVLVK